MKGVFKALLGSPLRFPVSRWQRSPATRNPPPAPSTTRLATSLPFADRADFDDANRGFIATVPDGVIAGRRRQAGVGRQAL